MRPRCSGSAALLAAACFLTACSDAPKTAETPAAETKPAAAEQPAGPVTGRTAFWAMYKPAHAWAADVLPLHLTGKDLPNMPSADGKSPVWSAVFVSPSKREAHEFTYSVMDDKASDLRKGVQVGKAIPWNGGTQKDKPFPVGLFVVDSDAAYNTAYAKAGDWAKKHPDKKAALYLGSESRFAAPVWYVIWGNAKGGFAEFIDATNGSDLTGSKS